MNFDALTTRDAKLVPESAALLIVDVQNFNARRDGGEYANLSPDEIEARYGWHFRLIESDTLPKMARLIAACRAAGIEVMYTVIESLTKDGRDRSLDYRITGFNVPRGSWDAKVLDVVAPAEDEIVLPKTSSNVFVSTNIDYVLRCMGKRQLIVAGLLTDQCVASAIMSACDLGYLVTMPVDACATQSQERQDATVRAIRGYCRQIETDALIAEIEG